MRTKILLVDDHPFMLQGLEFLINQQEKLEVVGTAVDAESAIKLVKEKKPDLVVMDIDMPGIDGLEATRQILESYPNVKVLFLSGTFDSSTVNRALKTGASGYILKTDAPTELLRAIEAIKLGKSYLCPEIGSVLLRDIQSGHSSDSGSPFLSDREITVLKAVAHGLRNKEIATQLNISVKAMESFRQRLMTKLGCKSAAELVRYAVREGLVDG